MDFDTGLSLFVFIIFAIAFVALAATFSKAIKEKREKKQAEETGSRRLAVARQKKSQKRTSIGASVGRDVSGQMNIAGRDIITTSPGDLVDCKVCDGKGYNKLANGRQIICDVCKGQGKIRL